MTLYSSHLHADDFEWEFKSPSECFPLAASLDREQRAGSCRSEVKAFRCLCLCCRCRIPKSEAPTLIQVLIALLS